ncbi:NUDIX domain-containing protein [Bacillus infantis]|uniref:NUDIX hydrolase n=1 Tax=Bacillus infantis TaxID=324767 RepID=UPI00101C2903|nr:NUDIX hydrolase [Bacillus infantis]RYI30213.1 NUDIX domain-containing protein [Bacillus infantis]
MAFYKLLGLSDTNIDRQIKIREAVRAIIIQDDLILLLQTITGGYKFPGGGVEEGETCTEALIREVAEETGYTSCRVKEKAGEVVERRIDEYDDRFIFQMNSHFYICELNDFVLAAQQLDTYEAELGFIPKWVAIDEAIEENKKAIGKIKNHTWLKRENFVLEELKVMLINH